MIFLWRFIIGLPSREVDIVEAKQHFPELFNNDPSGELDERIGYFIKKILIHYFETDYYLENTQISAILRNWLLSEKNRNKDRTETFKSNRDIHDCPLDGCPMRNSDATTNHERADSEHVSDPEINILNMMAVGGGKGRKPPLEIFLDLVRKTHRNQLIKEVILTDPYIYLDTGDDGVRGGFENLLKYLEALNIEKNQSFTLKTTPAPRNAHQETQDLLHDFILKNYPKCNLGRYANKSNFHDRFYLVRDETGQLSGVYGPSLNGLNAQSVVLMGDISSEMVLKHLEDQVS